MKSYYHYAALLLAVFFISSCQSRKTLFERIPASQSGLYFNNRIQESDSINVLNYEYLYNGGGVAVADFNNDGRQDLYFTGNEIGNRLYLNEGNMKFKDVTKESGTGGEGKWCSGVAVVDINNDGLPDLYVCATGSKNPAMRRNILYVNQGPDKNGVPVFKDEAAEYGLDDDSYSTQAAFLDYDHDGDLDVYIVTSDKEEGRSIGMNRSGDDENMAANTDRLYRNDWDPAKGHAFFTNVSKKAGITIPGYGLGVNVCDINNDGWPDIYVTDDYLSNDLLWINNRNGTFTNKAGAWFKHTSFSAMGNDVEDINNDGKPDIISLDMFPPDNLRKKTMTDPNNYENVTRRVFTGHAPEYTRNTLQLNDGFTIAGKDSASHPVFSDIAFLANIAQTDWSWTPLVADFDNDGYRDIVITNGIPRDITDKDFEQYRGRLGNIAGAKMLNDAIPRVKIANYAFHNDGNLRFDNVTRQWGLEQRSYSDGAVWADLDNDGDLDIVINNINAPVTLYKNMTEDRKAVNHRHWIAVTFRGSAHNRMGQGAVVDIYYDHGKRQVYENSVYRGYLSSVENEAHFGLGTTPAVDSLIVHWPDGKIQLWRNLRADRVIHADYKNAVAVPVIKPNLESQSAKEKAQPVFTLANKKLGIHFVDHENKYNDFKSQALLPHKLSQYGPGLAVGDINHDGLEDIFIGGSKGVEGTFLMQQKDGRFIQKDLFQNDAESDKSIEDEGVLFFDANGDGYPDLYIVSGSDESPAGSPVYQDRFYLNDGHGHFIYEPHALPPIHISGSCVTAADYDRDGDLDLFIGGRVIPGKYPEPVSGTILRNDSHGKTIKFTDVTDSLAPSLKNIGMITDALWSDFNNDGWPDLVITGEWMPVTFLKNDHGHFVNVTGSTGIGDQKGWWNSLVAGDFDHNGHIDYIAGNLGLNSMYKASTRFPVGIYAKDFANNGIYVAIPTLYMPDSTGVMKEYPAQGRDNLMRQLLEVGKKFPTYRSFGKATIDDILGPKERKGALVYHANDLQTSYIENKGNGKFTIHPLPVRAQFAPVFGMVAGDFNNDGNLDVLLNGNEYGIEAQIGRYDAMNGLLLQGNGKGGFKALTIRQSGIYIPGDGKALVSFATPDGRYYVAASQNNGPLKIFEKNDRSKTIPIKPLDAYAIINYKDGTKRKEEFYYGSSFLSASGRFMEITPGMKSVEIVNYEGKKRNVSLRNAGL